MKVTADSMATAQSQCTRPTLDDDGRTSAPGRQHKRATFRRRWHSAPPFTLMSSASADQYESGGVDPGDRCAAPQLVRCVSLANHGCTRRTASKSQRLCSFARSTRRARQCHRSGTARERHIESLLCSRFPLGLNSGTVEQLPFFRPSPQLSAVRATHVPACCFSSNSMRAPRCLDRSSIYR